MDIAAFVSAFGAGLLSFFSPCILPLLPVYVGILTTGADDEQLGLARRCANTVAFVLGICFVFVALGVGASALGSVFNNPYVTIALGIVVFAFGLVLAGFVKIPLLQRDSRKGLRRVKVRGVASAFLLGLAFSFGWTPCVGPILGSILALAAGGGNVAAGAGLLLVYALGLCIPFLVITLAANLLLARLSKIHKYLPAIQKAGGVLIAIMGLWMVFTQVGALATSASVEQEDAGAEVSVTDAQGVSAGDADTGGISSAWKNVVLTDLDGTKHRMSELAGSPVYFEFWGSWCTSCVADLGQLNEVSKEHEQLGDVKVVSVVTPGFYGERSADDFVAWARENGVEVPVYMDTRCSLAKYIGVSAFPTSVFVDSNGNIAKVRVGAIDRDELEGLLAELS